MHCARSIAVAGTTQLHGQVREITQWNALLNARIGVADHECCLGATERIPHTDSEIRVAKQWWFQRNDLRHVSACTCNASADNFRAP